MNGADPIVECVPNFSEGRRMEIVDALCAAVDGVGEVFLLDRESDTVHNRSVLTFAGAPQPVAEAAFLAARIAVERIDLTKHEGGHPRMGAVDVIPFIPIRSITMADCIGLAKALGQRLWDELRLPAYLYAEAAQRTERRRLPDLRKGQFEGIRDDIATNPARLPDFGEAAVHPTAGITAVGARKPLIAYNIYLHSTDLTLAKEIAKAIRERDGGLPAVQAMGVDFPDRGLVQVSCNLLDTDRSSIWRVFSEVQRRAAERGVEVESSELIGLVPERALLESGAHAIQLPDYSERMILELNLAQARARKRA